MKAIVDTPTTKEDELRDLLTTFTNMNEVKVYFTQEAYNIFDKAGMIKQSSKYDNETVLGKELVSIEGEDNVTFIGNLKELIFFDRSINTVKYEQYSHYGQTLNVATRHYVKSLDGSKIKKVAFTPASDIKKGGTHLPINSNLAYHISIGRCGDFSLKYAIMKILIPVRYLLKKLKKDEKKHGKISIMKF